MAEPALLQLPPYQSTLDRFMPAYRLRQVDRVRVRAAPPRAWAVVRALDAQALPLSRALFALRELSWKAARAARSTIDDFTGPGKGFQILAEEPGHEVVIGSVGKFWKADIEFAPVPGESFAGFDRPGYGKLVWALSVEPAAGGGSWISWELRVSATDELSWKRFRRYWRVIGPFSHLIRRAALSRFRKELGGAPSEEALELPGDRIISSPRFQRTMSATLEAPAAQVWPWLTQMGCQRAGWYSIDRLDNGGVRSAERIIPELQRIRVGDVLPWRPAGKEGFSVLDLKEGESLVLGAVDNPELRDTWAFTLEPIGAEATRLHARVRADFRPSARMSLMGRALGAAHWIMQRAQLRNLKRRVEGQAVAALLCLLSLAGAGQALAGDRAAELEARLREFDRDTAAFMWRIPEKRDEAGNPLALPSRNGPPGGPRPPASGLRSGPESRDRAEYLVDALRYRRLDEMEAAGLRKGAVEGAPWSDSYWPLYSGILAHRYADPEFPRSSDWKANADYVNKRLPEASSVETLSPAEKYDLIAGDKAWSLTRAMLEEGRSYYESTGSVESWMGICHGWAPASYMLQRPEKSVEAMAADGRTRVPFFPSDIKALASLLWANAPARERFVGRRCDIRGPKTDENGRVTDPRCLDTNPATFHQALVNQVGVSRRSFIMDASFDYQVWNQPVLSYEYSFFNPQSQAAADTLEAARVGLADFSRDKFKAYRAPGAESVVGVSVEVTYLSETDPSTRPTDAPEHDSRVSVQYLYDLELDARGTLVGGEWYQSAHPDFLWTPPPGARARSFADLELDRFDPGAAWGGDAPMPSSWKRVIPPASERSTPLARVVDALIVLSRAGL